MQDKEKWGWTVENAFSSSFFSLLTFPPHSSDGHPSVPCLGFDLYPALFGKCILGQQTYNSLHLASPAGSILKKKTNSSDAVQGVLDYRDLYYRNPCNTGIYKKIQVQGASIIGTLITLILAIPGFIKNSNYRGP